MIFYNETRNLWLNTNAIRQTITEPNELTRMDQWLTQVGRDPIPRFEREGWVLLTESAPKYAGEPLTGERVKVVDVGGTTFSWMVGASRWDAAIDTIEQQRIADEQAAQEAAEVIANEEAAAAVVIQTARTTVRNLINGSVESSKSLTVPFVLPVGSTLNGVDGEGLTVDIWLIHPELTSYWSDYQAMFSQRPAFTNEEFDTVQGRVTIPGGDMPSVFTLIAVTASQYRIAWRRLEAAYKTCVTAADYDALTAAILANQ